MDLYNKDDTNLTICYDTTFRHTYKKIKVDPSRKVFNISNDEYGLDNNKYKYIKTVSDHSQIANNRTKIGKRKWTAIFQETSEVPHCLDLITARFDKLEKKIEEQDAQIKELLSVVQWQDAKINDLTKRVVKLENMSCGLSKMNIVVTSSEFLKWLIKTQPQSGNASKLLDDKGFKTHVKKIINVLSGS